MHKTMKLLVTVLLMAALFVTACSGSSEPATTEISEAATEAPTTTKAPETEAPATEAPTTEAPTTEAPTTEAPATEAPTTEAPTTEAATQAETESAAETTAAVEKTMAHDFDSATNVTYKAGGYEFQIPQKWTVQEPYFYPSVDPESFGMVYYYEVSTVKADMLDNTTFVDSYAKGLTTSLKGDPKVLRNEMTDINGMKVLRTAVTGEASGMEMYMDFATMGTADGNGLLVLGMGQTLSGTMDYTEDFEEILKSLTVAKN